MAKRSLVAWAVVVVIAVRADAQLLLQKFESTATGFGWSLANAGDVDGDGHADVIVGSQQSESAQLFSGKDGSEIWSWASANPLWSFGYSVSGVGDVNGDGFPDVIVGAPALCCFGAAGGAFVYSGRDGSTLYTYSGAVDEGYGYCVAGIGDVNHDGRPDFAVSAYSNSANGTYAGKVVVYSGKTGGALYNFYGDHAQDFFGSWMNAAGDVNVDGYPDIVVGGYDFISAGGAGGMRVFSGKTGGILYDYQGTATGQVGFYATGAGDVNQDGFDDFTYVSTDRVEVRSGKTGAVVRTLTEFEIGGSTSLAGPGDVDGDGFADVIVGNALRDDGQPGGGHATLFSGKDGSILYEFAGAAGDYIGQAVGGGGDVDGDGTSDFLFGRYGAQRVEAYSGLPMPPASWTNYDSGWPGTNGVPSLTASSPPVLCTAITIDIGNSRGAATPGYLLEGLAPAHVPTPFGGFVLVVPSAVFALPLPAAGLSLPAPIPCDSSLGGATIYLQALEVDPGATKGISFSRGLKMILGGP